MSDLILSCSWMFQNAVLDLTKGQPCFKGDLFAAIALWLTFNNRMGDSMERRGQIAHAFERFLYRDL